MRFLLTVGTILTLFLGVILFCPVPSAFQLVGFAAIDGEPVAFGTHSNGLKTVVSIHADATPRGAEIDVEPRGAVKRALQEIANIHTSDWDHVIVFEYGWPVRMASAFVVFRSYRVVESNGVFTQDELRSIYDGKGVLPYRIHVVGLIAWLAEGCLLSALFLGMSAIVSKAVRASLYVGVIALVTCAVAMGTVSDVVVARIFQRLGGEQPMALNQEAVLVSPGYFRVFSNTERSVGFARQVVFYEPLWPRIEFYPHSIVSNGVPVLAKDSEIAPLLEVTQIRDEFGWPWRSRFIMREADAGVDEGWAMVEWEERARISGGGIHWVKAIVNSLVMAVGWCALIIVPYFTEWRRSVRRMMGMCPRCGYSLCGLRETDAGCPECGWNRPENEGQEESA